MSLGPQCWQCQDRRVRCDSAHPECSKCTRKGLTCPGYSGSRPLKWRHKLVRSKTSQSLTAAAHSACASAEYGDDGEVNNRDTLLVAVSLPQQLPGPGVREDDITSASVTFDTIIYYNSHIAPDIGLKASKQLTVSAWIVLPELTRHLYACFVTSHRVIKKLPDSASHSDLMHVQSPTGPCRTDLLRMSHHQASAINMIRCQLERLSDSKPDPELFGHLVLLMYSRIQQSAYGSWTPHAEGAKALLRLWGISVIGLCSFPYYVLMVTDIFGMAMSSSRQWAPSAADEHKTFVRLIDRLDVDFYNTLTPIPTQLLVATVAINFRRKPGTPFSSYPVVRGPSPLSTSLPDIVSYAKAFCPYAWSVKALESQHDSEDDATLLCQHDKDFHLSGWVALAQCFQHATILYAILSDKTCSARCVTRDTWDLQRAASYHELIHVIRLLFQRRLSEGHYKVIVWPMVVAGVEIAMARRSEVDLRFICSSLRGLTMELGAMSMHHAAVFLEELWESKKSTQPEHGALVDWDWIFRRAPIFLM